MANPDVIDDLAAEQDQLAAVLSKLSPADWQAPSAAEGWSVADVVLHLAQTEEVVAAALAGEQEGLGWRSYGGTVDDAMAAMVRAEPASPSAVFDRWQAARQSSVAALRRADPSRPVPWVASVLKPRTLATTRLAEHWAHGLDVAVPLGHDYPDTVRLRHVAWLAHSTLPYAFRVAGHPQAPAVFVELSAPDDQVWRFGDPQAESTITGSAGSFCRVGAQRLSPALSGLKTTGPYGESALLLLRTYATT